MTRVPAAVERNIKSAMDDNKKRCQDKILAVAGDIMAIDHTRIL